MENSGMSKFMGLMLVALGLIAGGFFPGYFYYQAKMNANYVSVKGLSEMKVKADLAVWELKFVVTGDDLGTAQREMAAKRKIIINFLTKKGFNQQEIAEGSIATNDLLANPYRSNEVSGVRYILTQAIIVRSAQVDLVAQTLSNTGDLIAQGVVFDNQYGASVSYMFTKLNEVKPQMLQQATKNAKLSAEEFAKSSESKVGKIRRANQGVFSILPWEQTINASEMSQIDKKIRVVSTIEYWLE